MMKDVLILPDIHGRTFWKDAVNHVAEDEHIIFLGDYLDPYPHERIEPEEAWDNFLEIIEYADKHANQVTMLLGNHDMHYVSYLYQKWGLSSRFNTWLENDFHQLFNDNLSKFCMSWECTWKNQRVLFTHAGVSEGWYKANQSIIGELTVEHLNQLLYTDEGIMALAQIGYERGGNHRYGSMVWADVDEMDYRSIFPNTYQIFGHSQQRRSPIITSHWACLDCRMAFRLSEII